MVPRSSSIPAGDEAIQLPIDDLALRLLRYLVTADESEVHEVNLTAASTWYGHDVGADPQRFLRAISESWRWLVNHGLVALKPGESYGPHFVTRAGEEIAARVNGQGLLRAKARIDVDLHQLIQLQVRRQFLLGEYELAAFAAMREVEIRVRELAGEPESALGVDLMKRTFGREGPLRDPDMDSGEADSTMALFWGAIGVIKNPSSHRQVIYDDPTHASEAILLADLLLRILDGVEIRLRTSEQ